MGIYINKSNTYGVVNITVTDDEFDVNSNAYYTPGSELQHLTADKNDTYILTEKRENGQYVKYWVKKQ